jgi:hypothetical protein
MNVRKDDIHMDTALPATTRTVVWKQQNMTIYFPQLTQFYNQLVEARVNATIEKMVRALIQTQQEQQGTTNFMEMIGLYEIKTNERNVLSISFSNYAYVEHYAHGLTFMKSVNFDLNTGENVPLSDLFKPDSNYLTVLSKIVATQIKERDIELLNPFPGVSAQQDFYITDKALVLYYQLYAITPYYVGFPLFPISVYTIENIILEDSILNRMIG